MCILGISLATLTEVFPCFSLSCKANARVQLAKTGHGQRSSKFLIGVVLFVIRVVLLLIVMFYVLFMCKCVLPPGDNPIAVDKYININNVRQKV
jgi:magnesium-transporting ATPase (P-type)